MSNEELKSTIQDIHDNVYQQGKTDVVNKLLSICGSFPNNNDCIECSFAIWKDNEWNGCAIEQLKGK